MFCSGVITQSGQKLMALLNRMCKLAVKQENSLMRDFVICAVRVTLSLRKNVIIWNLIGYEHFISIVTVGFVEVGGVIFP